VRALPRLLGGARGELLGPRAIQARDDVQDGHARVGLGDGLAGVGRVRTPRRATLDDFAVLAVVGRGDVERIGQHGAGARLVEGPEHLRAARHHGRALRAVRHRARVRELLRDELQRALRVAGGRRPWFLGRRLLGRRLRGRRLLLSLRGGGLCGERDEQHDGRHPAKRRVHPKFS
jgi:hypothetical protein